jgi:HSP90 family molecular chaperone
MYLDGACALQVATPDVRTLELNPHHPVIMHMWHIFMQNSVHDSMLPAAEILFEMALLEGGYPPHNQRGFLSQVSIKLHAKEPMLIMVEFLSMR